MKKQKVSKGFSIKFKLIVILLPVVILMILLLITTSYIQSNKIITENNSSILEASAINQVNAIESWLKENMASLQSIKTNIENTDPTMDQLQLILDSFYGYNSNYREGFYIGMSDGTILTATSSTAHDNESVSSAKWYKEGLTRINLGYGSTYVSNSGQPIISISGILDDGKDGIKVMSADVSLEKISIIVNSLVEMKDAETILVDRRDSTILAARDGALISTNINSGTDFYKSIGKKINERDFTSVQLNGFMVNFQTITGTDWVLISYVPESSVLSELYSLRLYMIIIGVISLVLITILIERVISFVLRPIKKLTRTIITMGEGDFSVDVEVKGNDEISKMSESLKHFIETMRQMITETNNIASLLYHQSEDSSLIATELFDSSALQSDSMHNLNTTVDELSHSINEIADNAGELAHFVSETSAEGNNVNVKIKETVDNSEHGRNDMNQVKLAMENIQNSIKNLETAINKVGNASGEITDILSLIGNIAEETSLLSLNASIEAARAGEAGKGFSVVASEIGKLSNNSTEAVQSINKLIKDIVDLVDDAVRQSKESSDYITESSDKIKTTTDTFEKIFDDIQETNTMILDMLKKIKHVDSVAANVAAISEEQAASSQEILATSEEMVSQASSITANSKRVANDSHELKDNADNLGQQVKFFKL